jgi:hypothetical protein
MINTELPDPKTFRRHCGLILGTEKAHVTDFAWLNHLKAMDAVIQFKTFEMKPVKLQHIPGKGKIGVDPFRHKCIDETGDVFDFFLDHGMKVGKLTTHKNKIPDDIYTFYKNINKK